MEEIEMDEIISLEKRRIEAMINQDANALDRILDDDLSYTHSSGQIETKAEFIANATSGVTRYRALSQEDVKVRRFWGHRHNHWSRHRSCGVQPRRK